MRFSANQWHPPQAAARADTWNPAEGPLRLDICGQDWSGYRSLHLDLYSDSQTGARVCLGILDGDGSVVASCVIAVDWVGPNPMRLWLANLTPNRDTSGLSSVAAVTLTPESPGYRPTRLRVGNLVLSYDLPLLDVNESDTVIDAAWHEVAARPEEWRVVSSSTTCTSPLILAPGDRDRYVWLQFGFPQDEEPATICVERQFGLDVTDISQILAKTAWDRDGRLTITAVVDDGREVDLVAGAEPTEKWLTVGASLADARLLRSVRMTLREVPDRAPENREILASLFWILLRRPTDLDEAPVREVVVRLASTHAPYPERVQICRRQVRQAAFVEPAESTTPIGDPLTDGLPFGFHVRREALRGLRTRVTSGPAARVFEAIRAEADRALETELVDRNYYGTAYGGGIGQRKGVRGAGMRVFAPAVALTHLITGEDRYAVACRRWILRAAVSDDWRGDHGGCVDRPQVGDLLPYWDSFTGWYPRGLAGYMNHPFMVADSAFGVVATYDMLYHCFSDTERDLVEQAFERHGTYILEDKLKRGRSFYVSMNQGILFALPLLMQTAFLARRDPTHTELHRWTRQFVDEFVSRPWNEEGVCGEGPGYGLGTVGEVIEALPVLAAVDNCPVEEVVPDSLRHIMRYVQHLRSTWDSGAWEHRPHYLGLSDGSEYNWVGAHVLAFFASLYRDPVAQFFFDEFYGSARLDSLTCLQALGDPIPSAEPDLPPAWVYRDQPMVFFRTGWRAGDSLVCLNNIRHVTGHGHRDRGSVIFEYGGEQLLLDPGMIGYSDPASEQYHQTFCHNTLTFSGRSQLGGRIPYDTSICRFASSSGNSCPGHPAGIDWAVADFGAVYPEAAVVRRHLIFLRPDICVLHDEVETGDEQEVWLNFTCLGELSETPGGHLSTTEQNRLIIASAATGAIEYSTSDWSTHWPEIPAHRLVAKTATRNGTTSVLTVVAAGPAEASAPEARVRLEGGVLSASIEAPTHQAWLAFRTGEETLKVGQMVSDGRGAVVRRMPDGALSGAVLDGAAIEFGGESVGGPGGPVLQL